MSTLPRLRRILLTLSFLIPLLTTAPAGAQDAKAVSLKQQGDAQAASGESAAAETNYKKAIAADPSYREGYTALSTHYLRQRKYSEAISLIRRAVKRDSEYGEGWYNLAYALRKSGKMAQAVKAYKTFATLDPDSADPYFGLGLAYKSMGKYADAAVAFRRYTKLEKRQDRISWVTKAEAMADEMEQKVGKAVKTPPSAPPARSNLREEADQLYSAGKVTQAAEKYQALLKANPGDTAALDALATCLFRLRRYNQAVKVFRKAVKANLEYTQGWYNLAYAQRKLGRHARAVHAYQRYIEKNSDNPDPYFGLALAYKGMGKKAEAARSFERYIAKERRPGQDKWIHRAKVEIARIKGKSAPAAESPALPGLPPVDADAKPPVAAREAGAAGKAKTAASKPSAADEEARRQRERDMAIMTAASDYGEKSSKGTKPGKNKGRGRLPLVTPSEDRPMAPPVPEEKVGAANSSSAKLRQQADTLARMGKCRQAQPLLTKATKLDPFNTGAYNGLAYCAYQLGHYSVGIKALSMALRDNPKYHLAWLHKARLERAASKNIAAVGSFRRYIAGGRANPDAHFELARTLRDLKMNNQAVAAYDKYLRVEKRAYAASQVLAAHLEMRALGGGPPDTSITMPGEDGRTVTVAQYIKGRKLQAEAANKEHKAAAAVDAKAAKRQARKEARERKAAEAKAAKEAKRQARKEAREAKVAEAKAAREAKLQAKRDAKTAREAQAAAKKAQAEGAKTAAPQDAAGAKTAGSLEVARALSGGITAEGTLPFSGAQTPSSMYRSATEAAKGLVGIADREFSRRHLIVAMGLYDQAAKLDPSSTEALYKGGVTAMALGQMDRAAAFYRKILRLNSEDDAARYNLELCRRTAREQAGNAAQVKGKIRRVEATLAARQYASADKDATALLGISPTAEVYLLRGQARLGKGNLAGALNDGGRSLSLDPDLPGAIKLLGDTHARSGKNKKALFFYRLYLARTPIKSSTARQRAQVQEIIKGL